MQKTLYYIHDPMCSWCYAFKPMLNKIVASLSNDIKLVYVCGGLAKHTDEPMPKDQQDKIKSIWKKIEQEVGTKFNYNFWERNTPQRATYLACQSLILARELNKEEAMLEAIQKAYYQKAQNPSKSEVLAKIAQSVGLDKEHFIANLNTLETQELLEKDLNLRRNLGVRFFPTLLLKYKKEIYPIAIDFNNSKKMITQIEDLSQNNYF